MRVDDVSEIPTTVGELATATPEGGSAFATTIISNVLANLARAAAVSIVTLLLPAYLTHRLSVGMYAAWVLILQLGAYVSYLDLGIQTGVSKFVAEYDALGDHNSAGRHASAGLALMILAGTLGLGITSLLAWQVPRLFSAMPADLYQQVRIGLLLVGSSLSFSLVCAVYSAVFLGLQRYWIPTTVTIVNRASFVAVVIAVVALRGSLAAMGLAVAIVNVATGVLQIAAWRKGASHVPLSIGLVEFRVLRRVARFCSLQSIWTIGMLCVTGLDITIVGHYDYGQTAYYAIAALPTNFVLLILSAMLGPLMPASSALSTRETPVEMGNFLARITRYSTVILLLTALPLLVCGFPILRLWVGSAYAIHTVTYLRILILANVIRNLCAPYATMISATGQQGAATATAICEAVVNLGSSIYLARHFGAIGVALGTLIGSFVSVGLHFAITMHFTRPTIAISRTQLLYRGLLHPAIVVLPSVLLAVLWLRSHVPMFQPAMIFLWGASTLGISWYVALGKSDRNDVVQLVGRWRLLMTRS
jgi:O-antigen/teichoic acid export membrane protein